MRRRLCFLLSFLLFAAAFYMPAGALNWRSIEDDAEALDFGDKVSCYVESTGEDEGNSFKIKMSGKGDIVLSFTSYAYETFFVLYNENGRRIKPGQTKTNTGQRTSSGRSSSTSGTGFRWNKRLGKSSGELTYEDLEQGTYYILVYGGEDNDYYEYEDDYDDYESTGEVTLTVKRGTDAKSSSSESSSSSTRVVTLYVSLNEGETLKLGATASTTGGMPVTWESTNPNIASVSRKGVVKALRKGSATINVYVGSKKKSIRITVT